MIRPHLKLFFVVAGAFALLSAMPAAAPSAIATVASRVIAVDDGLPPGLDPLPLLPVSPDDVRARLSLDDALADLAARVPLSAPRSVHAPEPGPAARDQAARHYIRGREAMLEQRLHVAIVEFDRALRLDPMSGSILRQSARAYAGTGAADRAAEFYERLRAVDPDDPEALLAYASAAAARGDFEQAAAAVARLAEGDDPFEFDPGAGIVASHLLTFALSGLGYPLAAVEASDLLRSPPAGFAGPSLYAGRLNAITRQHAEILRARADALMRLARHEEALADYREALETMSQDPLALIARLVYAAAKAGRLGSAEEVLIEALDEPSLMDDPSLALLIRFAADRTNDLARLRAALHARAAEASDLLATCLLAAALPHEEAVAVLRRTLLQPGPLEAESRAMARLVRRDLLARLAERDVALAIREVLGWSLRAPEEAGQYEQDFAEAVGASSEIVRRLRAEPESIHQRAMLARQLLRMSDFGAAHREMETLAADVSADDPLVLALRLELASSLNDIEQLETIGFAVGRADHAPLWIASALARLRVEDPAGALAHARRATELDPNDADAWLVLADAQSRDPATARGAIDSAERALRLDPTREAAFVVMMRLHDRAGPLADADRLRETVRRLVATRPHGLLVERLRAEELLQNGRVTEAVDRLLRLVDRAPFERQILPVIVGQWIDRGEAAVARDWLEDRLARRPHDPLALEQWARAMVRAEEADELKRLLETALARDSADMVRRRLLESVHDAVGERDRALMMAEQRLLDRPANIRRELDLAELYLVHERAALAAARLEPLLPRLADAPATMVTRLMGLIVGLPEGDDADEVREIETMRLRFVERYLQREAAPEPRFVSGGLLALGRLDRMDEDFTRLAVTILTGRADDSGRNAASIQTIRDVVQRLITAEQPAAAARFGEIAMVTPRRMDRERLGALVQLTVAAHLAAGQLDAAFDLYQRLHEARQLTLIMTNPPGKDPLAAAYYNLSLLCTVIGREAESERLLEAALERDPDDSMSLNNLGYRRVETIAGEADDEAVLAAAALCERALRFEPENSSVLDTVGWLRYRQGRFRAEAEGDEPGALELIEHSLRVSRVERDSPSAEVLDHLGDIRWRLGDEVEAVLAWRQARELLTDPSEREQRLQEFARFQVLGWGVLLEPPQAIYDRVFQPRLEHIEQKLEAVSRGAAPPIAPTFREALDGDHPDAR